MNKLKILLIYISSNRVWIITLACLDLFFIFLAWLANPDYFINYAALIIFVSFAALAIPLAISIRKRNKADAIFRRFLLEPDDTNEYLLCEAVPAVIRPLICELGKHLRTQQEYINEQKITVTDYEHYVENWVHEIKKPLSLMTLLLDNRKDEMSPLVHTRKGDPEAMNIVVQHYESYIASLSMRKLRDERGNIYWGIDEDIRDRLRSRLMRAVLSFKV